MQCINTGSWQSNMLTAKKHKEKLKMSEKKEYESPKMDIVEIEMMDVIKTSGGSENELPVIPQ